MASTPGVYVEPWRRWAAAGLQGITIEFYGNARKLKKQAFAVKNSNGMDS